MPKKEKEPKAKKAEKKETKPKATKAKKAEKKEPKPKTTVEPKPDKAAEPKPKPRDKPENTIFVGNKPAMTYCLAVITCFNEK